MTDRTGARVLLFAAAASALVIVGLTPRAGAGDLDLLLAVREWTSLLGSLVALGIGGLILHSLLVRSKVVPRWLSIWGLIGVLAILVRGVLAVHGFELPGAAQAAFAAPIGINEMVLAVWVIVKGFDTRILVVAEAERAAAATLHGG